MNATTIITERLQVDDLDFSVQRSSRRSTLGITIERDGALHLTAPMDAPQQRLEAAVRSRQFWIYSKLALRQQRARREVPRAFASGESYAYLGRSHRLWIEPPGHPDQPAVLLRAGRLVLRADAQSKARDRLRTWYTIRGEEWLPDRCRVWATRLAVTPSTVRVGDLGHRWGSCGGRANIRFHWQVMTLPPSVIEYVIVHELSHLLHANHTRAFWGAIERVLPDFEQRKEWLAAHGGGYVL